MSEDLPEGWASVQLGDVSHVALGKMLDRAKRTTGKRLPYLRNANVRWGRFRLDDLLEMPFKDDELERFALVAGDLLICEGGEPGRCAIWPGSREPVKYQKALLRIRAGSAADNRWVMFALRHAALQGDLEKYFTGSTIKHFPREAVLRFDLVLPPLEEQRRIIKMVEELLARVDAARQRLTSVPLILKRFRQSVLAAACTGKLTEDWRTTGHNAVAPARLLESIREARLRSWEAAERRKLALRGRTMTDAELRARYRLPPEAEAAFETPAVWAWATLDELTLLAGGLTKGQKRQVGARLRIVPYLRVANVQRGYLDLTRIKSILATDDEINDLRLEDGDILLNEGGDIDKLGRGWVWHGEVGECIHQNHVFRARPASTLVEPHFISHYANTFGQRFFFDAGAQTVNLASVSMSKIRGLPVPVPPVDEQREILRRVNALFGLADTIERRVAAASASGDVLTQSILAKAFRGELVLTEADLARAEGRNYESAEALLARIQAERAATEKPSKGQRGGALRASARS